MYNILVVDDEATVRNGIVKFISSTFEHSKVYCAENGVHALEVAKKHIPDILLTDVNMPKMNGIDLIIQIKNINPQIEIVIISGYDDFAYAQKAIELSINQYILKPIDRDELVSVLNKLFQKIKDKVQAKEDNQKLSEIINYASLFEKKRILRRLLLFDNEYISDNDMIEKFNVGFNAEIYTSIIIEFKNAISYSKNSEIMNLLDHYNEHHNDDAIKFYFFEACEKEIVGLITCNFKNKDRFEVLLKSKMATIILKIKKISNCDCIFITGSIESDINNIGKSHIIATNELHKKIFFNFVEIDCRDQKTDCHDITMVARHQKELCLQIELCNRNKALNVLNEIDLYVKEISYLDYGYISRIVDGITFLIYSFVRDKYIDLNIENEMTLPSLVRFINITEWVDYMSSLIDSAINMLEKNRGNRKAKMIHAVKSFALAHIDDENLSIEMICGEIYVSPNHLRQVFKKETGVSFTEYITKTRIVKSAQLLKDSDAKINDIAQSVGYLDSRYFSSCFKREFGHSPSDYRANQKINRNK